MTCPLDGNFSESDENPSQLGVSRFSDRAFSNFRYFSTFYYFLAMFLFFSSFFPTSESHRNRQFLSEGKSRGCHAAATATGPGVRPKKSDRLSEVGSGWRFLEFLSWVCLKMLCTPKPNGYNDYIPIKWLFHWEILGIYHIFRQTHIGWYWVIILQFDQFAYYCIAKFHGDSWWFMVIHGDSWWFMVIHGDSWWFMVIHGDSWWFMVIHGDSWWF